MESNKLVAKDIKGLDATPFVDPLPTVRKAVRSLLFSSPAFHQLSVADRQKMANNMVRVCHMAASLIREELESDQEILEKTTANEPVSVSRAQAAGDEFSGVAAERVADTTRRILNAVSFPRFVTDLINGVFKAMVDSNVQQMQSYVDLLNNVSASLDGFANSNLGPDRARAWLVEKYPDSFEIANGNDSDDGFSDFGDVKESQPTLRLRQGGSMPPPELLREDLGLAENDPTPSGDPERNLVPLARRHLAKMRQEVLATMVTMGLQRIVIDSGRINASMRFHIDTRSAAQSDEGSTLDIQNRIKASGGFNVGPWGVKAEIENNISYVSTQQTQTTEEMNTDLDLNSSVEIFFRSDYLPLNQLANTDEINRIRANSRNPAAEISQSRQQRRQRSIQSENERRQELGRRLQTNRSGSAQPSTRSQTGRSRSTTQPSTGSQTSRSGTAQSGTRSQTNRSGSTTQPNTGSQTSRSGEAQPSTRSQTNRSGSAQPSTEQQTGS